MGVYEYETVRKPESEDAKMRMKVILRVMCEDEVKVRNHASAAGVVRRDGRDEVRSKREIHIQDNEMMTYTCGEW